MHTQDGKCAVGGLFLIAWFYIAISFKINFIGEGNKPLTLGEVARET